MFISKIRIENFKRYKGVFELDLNKDLNIIVGDNESGKSTILEAVNLALSGFYHNLYVRNNIDQYLFNIEVVETYLSSIATGNPSQPPKLRVDIYFDEYPEFKGNHNTEKIECSGLYYEISFDESYQEEYELMLRKGDVVALPVEYYRVIWRSFRRMDITSRTIKYKASFIDSSSNYSKASDYMLSHIVRNKLAEEDKVTISQAFRKSLKGFIDSEQISQIRTRVADESLCDGGRLINLSVDLSSQDLWENSITPYLDKIPVQNIGKGEQCIIKTNIAISTRNQDPGIVLLEEPETHLSFGKLNELIKLIKHKQAGKQMLISTHSSFVLNKLGLKSLIMLANGNTLRLDNLKAETYNYFEKLAGYDTLRLLLSKKTILVEGDSDELVVQKAYLKKNGKLPIEDSIDIMCVRGLSFLRFLEIAEHLKLNVSVMTDNDGDTGAVERKYYNYLGDNTKPNIKICYDKIIDNEYSMGCVSTEDSLGNFNYNTLEPKLLKCNGLEKFKKIYGDSYDTNIKMLRHLHSSKGDAALTLFNTSEELEYPEYIIEAIS